MKVLFIGCWRDGTGYGNASKDWILALDSAGIDVVPRALKLNNIDAEVPERILELESQNEKGCDICIQCLLPHHMEYNGRFKKNIGTFFTETNHIRNTSWVSSLNNMDEIWVPCKIQKQTLLNSFVKTPIQVIPCPTDTSIFEQEYKDLDIGCEKSNFKFYTIGELTRRKNLTAVIKAFHLEFGLHEPVELIIKGHVPGMSSFTSEQHLNIICNEIKRGLKLYRTQEEYKTETFITKRLTNYEMMQLHHTCDCFVMPSYGEGWCIPAFNAMGMGKTPICTEVGGINSYLSGGGIFVDSFLEPVFGMNDTFPDLFMGNEDWKQVNISSLRKAMRLIYENKEYRENCSEYGMNKIYDFSYNKIGSLMKEVLEKEISKESFSTNFEDVCNRKNEL